MNGMSPRVVSLTKGSVLKGVSADAKSSLACSGGVFVVCGHRL